MWEGKDGSSEEGEINVLGGSLVVCIYKLKK